MDRVLFDRACRSRDDVWLPACGGTEVPFTKNGRRYLYCYNPGQGKHAYLCLDTDLILSDNQAIALFC